MWVNNAVNVQGFPKAVNPTSSAGLTLPAPSISVGTPSRNWRTRSAVASPAPVVNKGVLWVLLCGHRGPSHAILKDGMEREVHEQEVGVSHACHAVAGIDRA